MNIDVPITAAKTADPVGRARDLRPVHFEVAGQLLLGLPVTSKLI